MKELTPTERANGYQEAIGLFFPMLKTEVKPHPYFAELTNSCKLFIYDVNFNLITYQSFLCDHSEVNHNYLLIKFLIEIETQIDDNGILK